MERKKIAIIGVGLIGGSLALRLHEKKISVKLIGVDANEEHLEKALELELVDSVSSHWEDVLEDVEVIAVAIPVDRMVDLLPKILDKVKPHQMVFDLGSTKGAVVEAVKNHPNRNRFMASHPMWGTEFSGPQAAMANAFLDKVVILCNTNETDSDVVEWTKYMYQKIGMNIMEMEAKAHDLHAAYVSHISHITSFALANTVLEKERQVKAIFALASAGFESTVRLAKSNAAMWTPIFIQNKENVLDVLDEHIDQLTKFRATIAAGDEEGLKNIISHANKIKRILK